MKILISFLSVFILGMAGNAMAQGGGVYVTGKIGTSQQRVERHLKFDRPVAANIGNDSIAAGNDINLGSYTHGSFAGGVALGYNFKPRFDVPLRLDFEFIARSYRETREQHVVPVTINENGNVHTENLNINENSEIGVYTVMGNLYYDFVNDTSFTPFIGAGLGVAIVHVDIEHSSIEGYVNNVTTDFGGAQFAWGVTTGASYAINDDWSMELGYKYIDAGNKSLTEGLAEFNLDSDIVIHDILLGLRFTL
jgi:opacity protein-like surface antigen